MGEQILQATNGDDLEAPCAILMKCKESNYGDEKLLHTACRIDDLDALKYLVEHLNEAPSQSQSVQSMSLTMKSIE